MKQYGQLARESIKSQIEFLKNWVSQAGFLYMENVVNEEYNFTIYFVGTKEQIEEYKIYRPGTLNLERLAYWLLTRKMKGIILGTDIEKVQDDCDAFNNLMNKLGLLMPEDELFVYEVALAIDTFIEKNKHDYAAEVIKECCNYINHNKLSKKEA